MSRSAESPRSRQSRATRVRDLLRSEILADESRFRLTSEDELAREYDVSRNTMREALALLVEEGVLRRRKGVGTMLIVERVDRGYDTGGGFAASVPASFEITTVTIDMEIAPATPYLRARFGETDDTFVYWERLTLMGTTPHGLWRSYLPATIFSGLLTRTPPPDRSIYDIVRDVAGSPVARTRRTVEARALDPMTARLLHAAPSAPALHIERSVFTSDGRLMELGYAWVRGDRYAVTYDTDLDVADGVVDPEVPDPPRAPSSARSPHENE